MKKITDKTFIKFIKEMIIDFKSTGFPIMGNTKNLLKVLKQIKKTKCINIQSAIILYNYVDQKIKLGLDFHLYHINRPNIAIQLMIEWEYIKAWIENNFIVTVEDMLIIISVKEEEL